MPKKATKKIPAFSKEYAVKKATKKTAAYANAGDVDLELIQINALISALEQRAGLSHAKALEVVQVLRQMA